MTNKKIFSVSNINTYIKSLIDMDYILNNIWVQGEISNFKKHSSGHMYFTLKDKNSAISCVMFRSSAALVDIQPKNGMNIIVKGSVSVYEKTGQYQIYVNRMEEEGKGALYQAFEKLKKNLEEEGLFLQEIKKEIPPFPKCIGIITSPTGAAIRDIVQIAKRRNPNIALVVYPVLVQGEEASRSISEAIYAMNKWGQADVLIVGRGGGSIEDLWAFNEEIVARAIFDSQIPIVSAVGHETDFTIADFVADLRAPTPSAAAELAVPMVSELKERVTGLKRDLSQAVQDKIHFGSHRLTEIQNRTVFRRPLEFIYKRQQNVDTLDKMLQKQTHYKLETYRSHLNYVIQSLETLSPLKTIIRGYSITTDEFGYNISSVNNVKSNDNIHIRVKDGIIDALVQGIEKEEEGSNA